MKVLCVIYSGLTPMTVVGGAFPLVVLATPLARYDSYIE